MSLWKNGLLMSQVKAKIWGEVPHYLWIIFSLFYSFSIRFIKEATITVKPVIRIEGTFQGREHV
ncbi:hypothetical protein AT248_07375 [Bartonella henselae]|nr:hypothetical protein AT244_01810 [Bartonella henselae]OLL42355.1 hypothetical protein AT237_04235 [Bartonella henselae]OLL46862.1 hypothetical protein AT245_05650 [Bartonella henselae]OLL53762.1 hypothetical protein AT238_06635 [Bartonella henselae]OLL58808.1 hypothetical protein AT248_07375 [Bartonella henselae]